MKRIVLVLSSAAGDELGKLVLDRFGVPGAGVAAGGPVRPALRQNLEDLKLEVLERISAEGMATALDDLDLEIRLGQSLLGATEGGDITVRLPVVSVSSLGERPGPGDRSGASDQTEADDRLGDDELLAGLLDLDDVSVPADSPVEPESRSVPTGDGDD